jgi:hypothetical protein
VKRRRRRPSRPAPKDLRRGPDPAFHLWRTVGVTREPLRRWTIAHYLAGQYADPAKALVLDLRALDAAEA